LFVISWNFSTDRSQSLSAISEASIKIAPVKRICQKRSIRQRYHINARLFLSTSLFPTVARRKHEILKFVQRFNKILTMRRPSLTRDDGCGGGELFAGFYRHGSWRKLSL